jgi:WD40 repeat protein
VYVRVVFILVFTLVRLIEAHDGPITALAVDTYKVVSGSVDGAIRVWNVLDATPLREFSLGRDEEASWPVSTFSMTDTALMVVSGGRAICLRLNHSTHSTKKTSKSKKVRTPRRSAYELEQEQLERESPRGRSEYLREDKLMIYSHTY